MIYFLQPISGGPVKIGFSKDVESRRRNLEYEYGQPLVLLATIPGGRKEELAIHKQFSSIRLGNSEQFQPAAELMAFIDRPLLVGANPDLVERLESRNGTQARIDSDLASKARYLASLQNISLTEVLSRWLRPIIEREFRKAGKTFFEDDT